MHRVLGGAECMGDARWQTGRGQGKGLAMREMVRQVDCCNLLQTLRIQDDLQASISLFAPRSCASPKHAAHYRCTSTDEVDTQVKHCELKDTTVIMTTCICNTPVKTFSC